MIDKGQYGKVSNFAQHNPGVPKTQSCCTVKHASLEVVRRPLLVQEEVSMTAELSQVVVITEKECAEESTILFILTLCVEVDTASQWRTRRCSAIHDEMAM